jgi:hypothetical protein
MNSMSGVNSGGSSLQDRAMQFSNMIYGKGASKSGNGKGMFEGDQLPKGYKAGQLQNFTPEMMDLFSQMIDMLGPEGFLSRLAGGDESFFEEMEQPAWRKFQEAQGQLGSRFSELAPGAMSAQKGSGFKNTAGQLGSDFAMNLASNRRELQRQAIQDMSNMSNSLLGQRPYERTLTQKQPKESSGWGSLIGGALGGIGGAFVGNPLLGASVGSSIGSNF